MTAHIPGINLGVHCHNDTENGVANILAAVRAGARQIQGTLNGLGERCGNANLVSLIASLVLKTDYETGISDKDLQQLTHVSRLLDERLNRAPQRNAAYVGESAFAHKGGLHVSAVEKDPRTYEHIEPSLLGNRRHIVVSDQSGRANIIARFRDIRLEIDAHDPKIGALVEIVKAREFDGYAYDGAEASFELLARRALGSVPEYFRIDRFRVMDDRRWNARNELVTESEATITLEINGQRRRICSHRLRAALTHAPAISGRNWRRYAPRLGRPLQNLAVGANRGITAAPMPGGAPVVRWELGPDGRPRRVGG